MGFLLSFVVPLLVVGSVWLGPRVGAPNALLCVPFIVAYSVVPIVQAAWRRAPYQVSTRAKTSRAWSAYYRVLPLFTLPVQLVMVGSTTAAFVSASLSTPGRLLLLVTTGVFSAMFAINVAHELMHRRQKLDQFFAGVLLSTVCFGTFKVVHLQVHHPFVGTPLDFATARRGQTIYAFWLQAFIGNFREAIRCERRRVARSGKSPWTSEIVVWWAFTLLWLTMSVVWWGWLGGLFFLGQSAVAIMYLDIINYLQHYGLTRALLTNGHPEPIQDHHSWTQDMFLDGLILINLPRHANHHSQPQVPFQLLADSDAAPRYPYNYGIMTLSVLVPPVFRRIAHPCLDRFEQRRHLASVAV
jgi:alkane 1-monooxygenase